MDLAASIIEAFLDEIGRPNQLSLTISRFRGKYRRGGKDIQYYYEYLLPHKVAVYNNGLQLANLAENYHNFKNVQLIDHNWSAMAKEEIGGNPHHHIHHNPHRPEYWFTINNFGGVTLLPMPHDYILEMTANMMAYGDIEENLSKFMFHEQTALSLRDILADLGHITVIKDNNFFNAKNLKWIRTRRITP